MKRSAQTSILVLTLFLTILLGGCPESESNSGNGETPPASLEDREHAEDDHKRHIDADEQKEGTEADGHGDHNEHEEGIVELTPEAASRAEIRTAPVENRILAAQLSTTGQVDFDQTRLAHVSPRISGRVHRVHAVLGQEVGAGQALAEIDSIELGQMKAAFLQAKAREELARKNFDRTQSLLADRIVSEQEMLQAEASLREATAALQTGEETLHLYGLSQSQIDALTYEDRKAAIYPLTAPFAGTVIERHVTLGELVTPDRNLLTLADLGRVWIWIDVYQRDLGRVHLQDEARARVDAFPGEVFAGTVSYLSAQVDTDTRTVRARLDVDNLDGKLRPGMFVEVELLDPHAQAGDDVAQSPRLVVPDGAVVRDGEEFVVFVAVGERRYERRDVRIGQASGGFVEILGGLELGELVVVEGSFLLKSAASKESLGGGHSH